MSWLSNLFSKDEQQPSEPSSPPKPMATAADYCKQGQKLLDGGKLLQALEYFQAAIETDKRLEKAYLLLSEVYEKQGKKDKAKAALYALLAIDPNNERALKKIDEIIGKTVVRLQDISSETSITQTSVSNSNTSLVCNNSNSQQQSNRVGSYRVFNGKPEDAFDFFIVFDDGNRIYFKGQLSLWEVVKPNENHYSGWEGFIEPKGKLIIPDKVLYNGITHRVVKIGESAFAGCSLLETVVLPDSIIAINRRAFASCYNLKRINLPDSIKTIGYEAFVHCRSLLNIELPFSISVIESDLFSCCNNLEYVVIQENVKRIKRNVFREFGQRKGLLVIMKGLPPICDEGMGRDDVLVKVPKGTLEAYLTAPYWQCLNIQEET